MQYQVLNASGGRYDVQLTPPRDGVVGLAGGTPLPPELRSGRWLVIAAAVWSPADHEAIELVLEEVVAGADGFPRLVLAAFGDHAELRGWWPAIEDGEDTPLWIRVEDDRVVGCERGLLTLDRIEAELEWARHA